MISIAKLKKDMEFMRDMEGIVEVFKTTALVQFSLFQNKKKTNEVFLKELEGFWPLLAGIRFASPYVVSASQKMLSRQERKRPPAAIVLVTSDEGFLGGLNSLIVDVGLQRRTSVNDEIIVLGEQGSRSLSEKRIKCISLPGISEDISTENIKKLCDHLMEGFGRRFKEVMVVYPGFISLSTQNVVTLSLLPYAIPAISPERLKNIPQGIIIEPSAEDVAKAFVELWLGYKFLEIFRPAKQSEYAARIMHLEGSLKEISYLKQKITSTYFRRVHTLQDKTIREISAAKILLKGGK